MMLLVTDVNVLVTLLNHYTDLLLISYGCSFVGPLPRLLKSGCYPYALWNYG